MPPAIALAPGIEARTVEHLGDRWDVVTVDLRKATLDLWGGPGGTDLRDAQARAAAAGHPAIAATNAGMYEADHGPVGLFVVDGVERHPLVLGDGPGGNFALLPNGVFWIDAAGAHVRPSEQWPGAAGVHLATQSGPLLLDRGAVHAKFLPDSTNRLVRSGVGVSADGQVVHLVISAGGVRFHDTATLFRDVLGCTDALFLDGTVSMLWTQGEPLEGHLGRFSGVLVASPR